MRVVVGPMDVAKNAGVTARRDMESKRSATLKAFGRCCLPAGSARASGGWPQGRRPERMRDSTQGPAKQEFSHLESFWKMLHACRECLCEWRLAPRTSPRTHA